MIEGLLAWFTLFVGVLTGNPLYLIACGLLAIASRIAMRKEDEGK